MGKLNLGSWLKFKPNFSGIKLSSKLKVRPRFIWGSLIFIFLSTSILFYFLKSQEENLRMVTQQQLTTVQRELLDTIWAKAEVEKELRAEKGETKVLRVELDQKERQLKSAAIRLEKEIAARRQAETQLVMLRQEKNNLERKMKKFRRESEFVELGEIVVETTSGSAGEILEVNKQHNFVVASLGRRDDIKIGDILFIYRQDNLVGKARAEKIKEEVCAAAILPDWQNAQFKEKDMVKVRE